jgi:hypothetical protein
MSASGIDAGVLTTRDTGMATPFDAYLAQLASAPFQGHTEHTGRTALETLLNAYLTQAATRGLQVQHEPKRQGGLGAPDFKITLSGQVLGYVEVKPIGSRPRGEGDPGKARARR